MTVKEAIERLKYDREMCYFNLDTGEPGEPYDEECREMAQALDIAIGALEESESVGDCINRQALKQAMYHEAFEVDSDMQKWDGGCWIRYKLFEKIVDIMPSVQPKQKTGRWIDMDDHVMCSCCGATHYGADKNYCPNCGAKMSKAYQTNGGSEQNDI